MVNTKVKVNGLTLYVRVNGTQAVARIGSRGKLVALPEVYGSMLKGQSRKLRKQLREAGFAAAAGIERIEPLIDIA